jgi:hypothetical protein
MTKHGKQRKRRPKRSPTAGKKHINVSFPTFISPFQELESETKKLLVERVAGAAKAAFEKSVLRLREIAASVNPFQLLAHFAYYDRLMLTISPHGSGRYEAVEQDSVELLQALILQVPEGTLQTSLGEFPREEILSEVNTLLHTVRATFAKKRIGDSDKFEPSRGVAEIMRTNTAFFRNAGFGDQIENLHDKLFKPLDDAFEARSGVRLTNVCSSYSHSHFLRSKRKKLRRAERANIRDAHMLYEIQPLNLFAYLRGRQWHEDKRLENGAFWVKKTDEGDFEILLPSNSGLRDYPNRISDLLKTLERVEGRSQLEIVEDLLVSSADVIRQRLPGAKPDGSITLERGMRVYEKARDLMLSAACAAIEFRPLYPKRKPEQAMQYLNHACFGTPKQGSYILTIISPVAPKLRSEMDLFGEEEPFERRTVRTLAEAWSLLTPRRARLRRPQSCNR